jgi:hypothetical protein
MLSWGSRATPRVLVAALAVACAAAAAQCSGSPTAPPPPRPNAAPVVRAVDVSRTQLDSGQDLDVTATVEDAETAPDLLRYAWTAQAGAFTGEGRSVRWRAPADGPAPEYTLTVTVTESYIGAGGIPAEHRVTGASAPVRVNDGMREMRLLAETFLSDFEDSTKSAEYCVRNFTDSCRGKRDELGDIQRNRKDFTIVGAKHDITSITLNSGWPECTAPAGPASCALVIAPVDWRSLNNSTGAIERQTGQAFLTGVYEGQRWWLCDSRYFGPPTLSGRPFLR